MPWMTRDAVARFVLGTIVSGGLVLLALLGLAAWIVYAA